MDIHVRKAGVEDLEHLLHHRRAMFDEMGFRDPVVLDRMEELSKEYFHEALRTGRYWGGAGWRRMRTGRSWEVEALLSRPGRVIPERTEGSERGFSTCIRNPNCAAREWPSD
jgi:hypothetical protein